MYKVEIYYVKGEQVWGNRMWLVAIKLVIMEM